MKLSLQKNEDGYWINIEANTGKKAMVYLDVKGRIVKQAIADAFEEQSTIAISPAAQSKDDPCDGCKYQGCPAIKCPSCSRYYRDCYVATDERGGGRE